MHCVYKSQQLRYEGNFVAGPETYHIGPFQGYDCDQKSGKFHILMATAPVGNMLSISFWLITMLPVGDKTCRSLKT